MKRIVRCLLVSVCLAGLATPVAAQFSRIPGSGCPGILNPRPSGQPMIGQTVTWTWSCAGIEVPILLFGSPIPLQLIAMPPACATPCNLAVNPFLFVAGAPSAPVVVPIAIPNDPALRGAVLRVQGACFNVQRLCVSLGLAVDMKVQ